MANISTNEFRSGVKVMMDGDPCNILENEFVKPGKGQAFNRVKLRNLKSGRVLERTFNRATHFPPPMSWIWSCSIYTATAMFGIS